MEPNPIKAAFLEIAPNLNAAARKLGLNESSFRRLMRGIPPYLPASIGKRMVAAGMDPRRVEETALQYLAWRKPAR